MKDWYLCICASTFCIYRTGSQQIEILVKALSTVITWWDDTKSRHHILIRITAIKSKYSHLNNNVLLKGRQYLGRNQKHIYYCMDTNTELEYHCWPFVAKFKKRTCIFVFNKNINNYISKNNKYSVSKNKLYSFNF